MTKRAVIYARYSTGKQNPLSTAQQVDLCTRLCEREGWTVVRDFRDEKVSGRKANRSALKQMFEFLRHNEVDVVIVEGIDRLDRSVKNAISRFELLTFDDIALHSVTEGPQSFITVLFNALGAQFYVEMVAEHTRRARGRPGKRRGCSP